MRGSFGERYLLSEAGGEGLLLDLERGDFYRINRAACAIVKPLLEGHPIDETAAPSSESARMLEALERAPRPIRRGPIEIVPAGSALEMRFGSRPTFRISPECAFEPLTASPSERELRILAPHLLALEGVQLLHASCVRRGGSVLAFTGPTGAGKSTLAQTFAAAGWEPIADDVLVCSIASTGVLVRIDAEVRIREWTRAATSASMQALARELIAGGGSKDIARLETLWVIDGRRVQGAGAERSRLEGALAIARVLENTFAETGVPSVWRSALELASSIAREVRLSAVSPPDGHDRLLALARELTTP